MSQIPTVAIVGRPNAGKSTLFNRLLGKRKAIVSDIPGTTRDIVATLVNTPTLEFLLLDTGGIGGGSGDTDLEDDVATQTLLALEHADLILFTIDSTEDLLRSDYAAVDLLRKKRRRHVPVLLVITKCDSPGGEQNISPQCHALGIADATFPLSAIHNIGIDALRTQIVRSLCELHFSPVATGAASPIPRIAVIGKPNVGKSSLINVFMSPPQRNAAARLVSAVPGTTRDASDTVIKYDEKSYILVDTAGLRRKARITKELEHFASIRSIRSITDADIVVLVLDAVEPVSQQDKRIARLALDQGKGLILLLNKIDAIGSSERSSLLDTVRDAFSFCCFCPVVPCSTRTREGVTKIFSWFNIIATNRSRRIPTKELHRWYDSVIHEHHSPFLSAAKHLTQSRDIPPTFVLFARDPHSVPLPYLRFLEKRLRSTFAFEGTPIRWLTKAS